MSKFHFSQPLVLQNGTELRWLQHTIEAAKEKFASCSLGWDAFAIDPAKLPSWVEHAVEFRSLTEVSHSLDQLVALVDIVQQYLQMWHPDNHWAMVVTEMTASPGEKRALAKGPTGGVLVQVFAEHVEWLDGEILNRCMCDCNDEDLTGDMSKYLWDARYVKGEKKKSGKGE